MVKDRMFQWRQKAAERLLKIPLLRDKITRYLVLTLVLAGALGIVSLLIYDRTHCFDDYSVISRAEENDVDGTLYQHLGSHIIKYSHDGVFCVDTSNNTVWSTAYTMQTPIADVNGKTMAIAEQQGKQVFILNESGMIGSFQTTLPIISISVSSKGETALILDDSDVTWINLYQSDGTQIAAVKTTTAGTGYPVDAAITADARRMMVSYMSVEGASLTGKICFYDFSSASEADEDHLTASYTYSDMIFPEVYYTDAGIPVAVGHTGYVVYTQGRAPEEKQQIPIEEEIVSTFHDDTSIGFIFHSSRTDVKYHMAVYNLNGRMMMETDFSFEYEDVRMDDGEILLYDASSLNVYRTSGKAKLIVTYQKNVKYFTSQSGLRKYLVITDDTMDRIRIS